ncbi:hypothetical protein CFC21_085725 [Triticum aestivum]|uniref:Late embryogenesis abundant protein LEA-2 subgroup domain-containing protein n=2 Tax=Triticum aestivum TaxID=4565 RepID=A0A9R1L8Q6_WHEAT|nr:hypothetical protein CFC21_085718 [Triticum aestivum]KAF7081815.1 hypothetical protein CFC21_085725 [Triticum aestivum]
MATSPPFHPSAPISTGTSISVAQPASSTSIAIAVGIPSLPSIDLGLQEQTTGGGEIHELEQDTGEIRGQQPPNNSPEPKRACFHKLKEFCEPIFWFLQVLWGLTQQLMPIPTTLIIYWLVYRPDRFHPRIDSAILTAFDLTNATLQYDLDVDLSFRNSHRLAIRYLDVAASVFYNGTRLGPTDDALPSFIQGRKNTTVLHPAFHGVVTVDSGVAAELQRESTVGTVHLRVTVSLTLMYKVLFIKDVFFYKYDCWLWFLAPRNDTPALFFADADMCWRADYHLRPFQQESK